MSKQSDNYQLEEAENKPSAVIKVDGRHVENIRTVCTALILGRGTTEMIIHSHRTKTQDHS